jgi:hypothetical protein
MIKTNLRKGFYAFDLLIVSIYMVFMWHSRYHVSLFSSNPLFFQWALLLYPMLLRVTADFLLYHREKRSLWTILIFMTGYFVMIQNYSDCCLHLVWFPFLLCDTQNSASSLSDILINTSGAGFIITACLLIAWIALVPIIVFLILFFRKQLKPGLYSWGDVFGRMMFENHTGKVYMSLAAMMFLAYTSGLYTVIFISKVALFTLPAITYCIVNRYIGRKVVWYEPFVVFAAMLFFFEAQYKVNGTRIAFLGISACLILAVCIWMGVKSKRMTVSVFAFLLTAFIVPSFSIGYNVYRVTDETILRPYRDEYINRGVFITGKKVDGNLVYGIRDRYRKIIPANYDRVEPYDWYNHEVALTLPTGKIVYDVKSQRIVHSFTSQNSHLRDYLQFTSCEELQENAFDAGQIIVMETHTGKIKAMVKFGEDDTNKFSTAFPSGLIKPIALLAALETGGMKPADCMKQGIESTTLPAVKNALTKEPNSFFSELSYLTYSDRDSICGIDNVPSVALRKYALPHRITADYASRLVAGSGNAIPPIQMLNGYNVILNQGKQYLPLLYEDVPSCRFGIAKSENTMAVNAAMDKSFADVCRKAGIKLDDISGYYSVQKYGHSYAVGFCGYYPKKSPRYTFILSLKRSDSLSNNEIVLQTIRNIAYYLKTGQEFMHYSDALLKRASYSRLAQYQLGVCYEDGLGIQADNQKSTRYYEKSAKSGYALAQWKLYTLLTDGWLSDDGITDLQDTYGPLLKKCAEQGYSDAQFCLGSEYRLGYLPHPAGVTSKEEAIKWFRLAAKNGDATAREYLQGGKNYYQYGY